MTELTTPTQSEEEIPIWDQPTEPLRIPSHLAAVDRYHRPTSDAEIIQPSVPHAFTEYIFASSARQQTTLLGQVLALYEQAYSQWPWNEQHERKRVFANLHQTLHPNDTHTSFWHVAKRDGQVVGGLWGIVTDMNNASYWLMPNIFAVSSKERGAFEQKLDAARERLMNAGLFGFSDRYVTIIRDFVVSSPKYVADSEITRKETINARANGIVALQLLKAMLDEQIANGYPNFLAYTVRKKPGVVGRQPPMYTMTTLLGGRDLMTIGDLPGDPSLELVVVGGDLRETVAKFDAYSQEKYGRLLLDGRRQAQATRRVLH